MSLVMISSLQPYSHHSSEDALKTIGNSMDALLRMSTDFGPDSCPYLAPSPVMKEFCCCCSAGVVIFLFLKSIKSWINVSRTFPLVVFKRKANQQVRTYQLNFIIDKKTNKRSFISPLPQNERIATAILKANNRDHEPHT